MANDDLDLDVDDDAEDYASVAARDNPATRATERTHVSDAAFAEIRASYTAKHDNGSIHKRLATELPPPATAAAAAAAHGQPKPALSNKQIQLVSEAAGELYYFRNHERLLEVIAWLRDGYDVQASGGRKGRPNGKFAEALERWEGRCRARIAEG